MKKITKYVVASALVTPVIHDVERTVDQCRSYIVEAAQHGAKLIVFPETFVPSYPWWEWLTLEQEKRDFIRHYILENSVKINDELFEKICQTAKEQRIHVIVSVNEVEQGVPYHTQVFINEKGEVFRSQRRLLNGSQDNEFQDQPTTYMSRLGEILVNNYDVNQLSNIRKSITTRTVLHLASWAGFNLEKDQRNYIRMIDVMSKNIARHEKTYVILSSTIIGDEELAFYEKIDPSIKDTFQTGYGITGIIAPNGEYVAPALQNEQGIYYGEVDLSLVASEHPSRTIEDLLTDVPKKQTDRREIAKEIIAEKKMEEEAKLAEVLQHTESSFDRKKVLSLMNLLTNGRNHKN